MEGDLSVTESEVVRVVEKQNEDWYVVENSSGEAGLFPGNHLDPNTEFSGKALFDIEQLLAFKSDKNQFIKVSVGYMYVLFFLDITCTIINFLKRTHFGHKLNE